MKIIRKISFKLKVFAVTLILLIISNFLFGLILRKAALNIAIQDSYEYAELMAKGYAANIEKIFEESLFEVRTLAAVFSNYEKINVNNRRELLNSYLKKFLETNPSFLGVWCGWEPNVLDNLDQKFVNTEGHDATGRFVPYWYRSENSIKIVPLENYDQQGAGDYYQLPKKTLNEQIIEPYLYEANKKEILMTSIAVPIINNSGNFVGVVGIDLPLDFLQEIVSKIKPMETGVAALFSNSGIIAAHFDPTRLGKQMRETERDMIGEKIFDFADSIKAGKKNSFTFYSSVLKTDVFIITTPVASGSTKTPWGFAVGIPMDKVTAKVKSLQSQSLIISIISVFIISLVLWLIIQIQFKPFKNILNLFKMLISGQANLMNRITIYREDEFGELASYFNQFIARIEELVKKVKENVLTLSSAAVQISSSTEELAATSEEQSNQAKAIVNSIKELQTTSADIASTVDNSNREMQKTASKVQEGSKIIGNTIQSMNEVESRTANLAEILRKLTGSTDKIGKIINVINEVAEQTNLLALNAAIEAARAGEAGRGFAVVADEVRKLAERTSKATQEIEEIISSLQEESQQASAAMEQAIIEVKKGRELGNSSLKILGEMTRSVDEVSQMLSSIASAVTEENAAIDEIGQNVQGMGTATQEAASAIHQIAVSAEDLAKQSDRLKNLSDEFITG